MNLFLIPLLVAVGAILAACSSSTNGSVSHGNPDDEIMAVGVEVLRTICEGASVKVPSVTYVEIAGASSVRLIELARIRIPMLTLKPGRNYDVVGGRVIDRDTGQRCSALSIEVRMSSAKLAEAFEVWMSGTMAISQRMYKLARTDKGWIVTDMVRGPIT